MFKKISNFWQQRRQRFYRRNRWHFIIDTSLSLIIVILLVAIISLSFYRPEIDFFGTFPPRPSTPSGEPEIPEIIADPLEVNFSLEKTGLSPEAGALLTINYYNSGEKKIEKIVVSWEVLSAGFSLSKIQNVFLEADSKIVGRDLVINNLEPEESGQAKLKIYWSLPTDPLLRESAWRAVINHVFKGEDFRQEKSLPSLRFLSDTKISSTAYYHSLRGDQLGIGPIPPLIGIPTTYWVFFEIDNQGNDLTDLLISGRLPDYAQLGSGETLLAGNLSYNEDNRRIIWQVPLVDKIRGAYRAGFEVEISPQEEHVGQVLNLVEDLTYRFTDTLCQEEIEGRLNNLDTNVMNDFINKGQGTVRAD